MHKISCYGIFHCYYYVSTQKISVLDLEIRAAQSFPITSNVCFTALMLVKIAANK
jgi:hypothetical protein